MKDQRNKAQDELSEIRKFLELSDDISLREYILNFISQSEILLVNLKTSCIMLFSVVYYCNELRWSSSDNT